MTDKQIIIDGVDVSGCLFFTQYGFCTAQLEILGGSGKCSVNNQNCDYKQLNQLKAELEAYKMEAEEGKEINAELKAENDGLKESCKNTSTSLYAFMGNCSELHYKIRNLKNKYKKEITKQAKSILKLKQAIEKIKEIAEKKVAYFPDGEIFARPEIEQILQICDEVNDERS